MRFFFAFFILGLAGCYDNSHVDNVRLNSEAEHTNMSGLPLRSLTVTLSDSKKDLVDVRPIPGTAYLWNASMSKRLDLRWMMFNGRSPYDPNDGKVSSIGFAFVPEGTKHGWEDASHPLSAGVYNISVQFNGNAGIYTACGSFRVVREHKMLTSRELNDLH